MLARISALLGQYGGLLVAVGLLCAVYLLPPDTSLAEIRRNGILTACVPPSRPPLITGDPQQPGLEIELLEAIADEIGVRFVPNTIASIGQDFDPSLWRITRAQCAIIGGGMLDTADTRAFLEVSPAYGETGWMVISKTPGETIEGRKAVVLANIPGVDRLGLSRFLRQQNVSVRLVRTTDDLAAALQDGSAEIAITDALFARKIAADLGFSTQQLPPPFGTQSLVFGLWKGDLTLKRAIRDAFSRIERDGRLMALVDKYLGA